MNEVNKGTNHERDEIQSDPANSDDKKKAGDEREAEDLERTDEREAEDLENTDGRDSAKDLGESDEGSAHGSDHFDEIAVLKDQLLRSAAEFENIKRRAAKDVENAHKFGSEKLVSDLLPVLDSLYKAIDVGSEIEGAEAMTEGIELSVKMFLDALGKNGLQEIDPLGEPFDPALHEALAAVPNEDAESNSVMEVIQKGYSLNERLVRAAKVVVVKE